MAVYRKYQFIFVEGGPLKVRKFTQRMMGKFKQTQQLLGINTATESDDKKKIKGYGGEATA